MHERKAEATEPLNETALPLQRMRMGDRPIEDTSDIRNAYAQGWRFSLSSSLAYLSPSFRFLFSHPLLSTSPSFHASFLPHSTDGFTRTLSLFLPLFLSFSHPLFEFYLFFNFPFSQMNFPNCCLRLLKLVSIFNRFKWYKWYYWYLFEDIYT